MSLFSAKPKTILGVAISDSQLSIVELCYKKQKWHLIGYGIVTLDDGEVIEEQVIDSEQLGQHISTLITQIKSKTIHAATALSANLVTIREIELPSDFSEQDIEAQIRVDADRYIPYPLSQVSLDFEILGYSQLDPNFYKILLVVTLNEHVEQHSDALIFGGLQPKVIDIVPEALCRALQLMLLNKNITPETVALVDIGKTTTTVYIAYQGAFVFHLQQLFGEHQLISTLQTENDKTADETDFIKLTTDLTNESATQRLQPFIIDLVHYISRALQQFATIESTVNLTNNVVEDSELASQVPTEQEVTNQEVVNQKVVTLDVANLANDSVVENNFNKNNFKVDHIILSGRSASLPKLDTGLQKQIGLSVSLANPFKSMTFDPTIDVEQLFKDAPQLLTACGLSLCSQSAKLV